MQRIAVIGGGIAGLTVALRRARQGDNVVLFEAAPELGGQLVSELDSGFVVEHGAEGFIARSEAVPRLADDVGLAAQLVGQLEQTSFLSEAGTLVPLEPGEAARRLGFQVQSDELGRGIRSFWNGMAELPREIERQLGLLSNVELRRGIAVSRIAPDGPLARVWLGDEQPLAFDAVVVATTARSASALLGEAFGDAARALENSAVTSSLTVSLGFARDLIQHALDGTGFIVPDPETHGGLRAAAFSSSKLPNRAPEGHALLRLFFRPNDDELHSLSDAAWIERAEAALARVLPLRGNAARGWVSRWANALPVFDDTHRARVAALEASSLAHGIWLTGSAFHGAGIDAAVRSAERIALAIPQR